MRELVQNSLAGLLSLAKSAVKFLVHNKLAMVLEPSLFAYYNNSLAFAQSIRSVSTGSLSMFISKSADDLRQLRGLTVLLISLNSVLLFAFSLDEFSNPTLYLLITSYVTVSTMLYNDFTGFAYKINKLKSFLLLFILFELLVYGLFNDSNFWWLIILNFTLIAYVLFGDNLFVWETITKYMKFVIPLSIYGLVSFIFSFADRFIYYKLDRIDEINSLSYFILLAGVVNVFINRWILQISENSRLNLKSILSVVIVCFSVIILVNVLFIDIILDIIGIILPSFLTSSRELSIFILYLGAIPVSRYFGTKLLIGLGSKMYAKIGIVTMLATLGLELSLVLLFPSFSPVMLVIWKMVAMQLVGLLIYAYYLGKNFFYLALGFALLISLLGLL